MYRYALAALCLHLFFNVVNCTGDVCSPLICRSDLSTSSPSNESSGSGANKVLEYVLDVEEKEDHIAVSLRITGSWHYTDPGPAGYMLDVFEEGIPETYIGQFADPHPRSTAKACTQGKKTIMFKSCEPTVLDLPRTYKWTANEAVQGDICFRATIQSHDDQSCQTLIECRSLNLTYVHTEQEEPTKSVPGLIVHNVQPSAERIAKCQRKINCTGATLKDFCCSDGNIYASRCHKRLGECIYSTDLSCSKKLEKCQPELGLCAQNRDLYRRWYQWDVMCDCYGDFKPIQCFQNICMCINKQGEQEGDEVIFEGSDKLNLSCF